MTIAFVGVAIDMQLGSNSEVLTFGGGDLGIEKLNAADTLVEALGYADSDGDESE